MKPIVAYYRVSTELQQDKGYSLSAQRDLVHRYAHGNGVAVIAEFEEAESGYGAGSTTLERRPALRAALAACRRQKAILVIAALDRLARNVVFVATLVETKVPFVALDLPGATPFIIHIYAAIAEEESRQKGRLISASIELARATGDTSRHPCLRSAAEARQRAEAHRRTVDKIRARGIFGVRPTTDELNRLWKRRHKRPIWTRAVVERMLRYLGYGERAALPRTAFEAEARAAKLLPLLARLRASGMSMPEAAEALNRRGYRTARGQKWTCNRLWNFVRSRARRADRLSSGGPVGYTWSRSGTGGADGAAPADRPTSPLPRRLPSPPRRTAPGKGLPPATRR